MNIHNINLVRTKNGKSFLKHQLLSVIIFATLYWIGDYLLSYYPKFSKKMFLGYYNKHYPPNPYYYWLWHSLVTQSTVGYAGLVTEKGENISMLKLHSNIYKVLNFAQLASVFYITAINM